MVTVTGKPKKTEKREYTFMIVPHHGKAVVRQIRIPMKLIHYSAAAACVFFLLLGGFFIRYWHVTNAVKTEKAELETLRQVNGNQEEQIQALAKVTADLQQDMNRLNKLDADLRRIVNSDDSNATSRAGLVRPATGQNEEFNGQGGPSNVDVTDLLKTAEEIKDSIQAREQSLTNLKEALNEKKARLAAKPSIWPASGQVTSRFGYRQSPWGGGGDFHPGIDIANDYGTPIVATADGKVIFSDWYSGYGMLVQIDHGNGIVTMYGHNQQIVVKNGDVVKKGQVISYMGSTGLSTGPHVHYEVRINDKAIDPAGFL